MLNELKKENNRTRTENGAAAFRSTDSFCLDLFSFAGTFRYASSERIQDAFTRAYAEDPDLAMKILFYARDVREGLGEKRFFRIALITAAMTCPQSVIKNIAYIAEYGRFDDLMYLAATPCRDALKDYLNRQLNEDLANMAAGKPVSLLAKWLPSVNASSKSSKMFSEKIRPLLGLSEKKYRRMLSSLRSYIDVLEKRLCKKDYSFDYAKQPSKALFTYRKAFYRNDRERYTSFIESVRSGKSTLNTSSLYPYDIVRACEECERRISDTNSFNDQLMLLDTAWRSLTAFDSGQNAIAVVDGSGSMYNHIGGLRPIDIAVSLGIYFAGHSSGAFADHFITFSETPRLVELKGRDIYEKVRYCESFCEIANTDIAAVFDLIIDTAVKNHLPQSEMPEVLYIISDMEFDEQKGTDLTVFEYAKRKYERHGYRLPTVVFWDVDARTDQHPVRMDTTGAVLVSGASPMIFKYVIDRNINPMKMMLEIVGSERYDKIAA